MSQLWDLNFFSCQALISIFWAISGKVECSFPENSKKTLKNFLLGAIRLPVFQKKNPNRKGEGGGEG